MSISTSGSERLGRGGRQFVMTIRSAAKMLGVSGGDWTISFVDDEAMMELHQRSMGLATTTDVLTFDLSDAAEVPAERSTIELDTVICIDEAARRAAELGHPLLHEVLLYGVHSLLHVLGHDDTTPAKSKAMHRREDEILTALGIGPVFHKPRLRRAARQKRGGGR